MEKPAVWASEARARILSAMLEQRSERDLARLRMALEQTAQLEKENRNLAGERIDKLA